MTARFGIGLAALGRPGYMTLGHAGDLRDTSIAGMFTQTCEVLDAAYAHGIRHLDTARSYGTGEQFAARWLAARGHTDVVVSSKWGYRYTADWQTQAPVHEVKDLSLAHFESQWLETRAALGKHLSIYQIHSVTLESGVLDDAAVLERLVQLRNTGVAAGLSATGPNQAGVVRKAASLQRDGRRIFDWVQATWNLLEPSVGDALAEAKALGMHTIAKESLANGRLTERGDVAALKAEAHARGVTPDALALAVTLAQPFLDVVLLGAATVVQLDANVQARTIDSTRLLADPGATRRILGRAPKAGLDMNLLLLDPSEISSLGRAELTGRRAEHGREVLRLRAGDLITVGIRNGLIGTGKVIESSKKHLVLDIEAHEPPPKRPGIDVILAIPRPKALKRVIPALASFGVDRILLINAARVEKSYFDAKVLAPEVLAEHIDLGLEQGKDTVPPSIEMKERFKPFIEDELDAWAGSARRVLLHPGDDPPPKFQSGERLVLAIGPDGGWVPFELELMQEHGFTRMALGSRPLRVEVAVPAIIGAAIHSAQSAPR